jgi:hypothetical protein
MERDARRAAARGGLTAVAGDGDTAAAAIMDPAGEGGPEDPVVARAVAPDRQTAKA